MAVAPENAYGIAADSFDTLDSHIRVFGPIKQFLIGRAAHVVMSALAFGAGADGAQSRERVMAFLPIVPADDQFPVGAVGNDIGWFDLVHGFLYGSGQGLQTGKQFVTFSAEAVKFFAFFLDDRRRRFFSKWTGKECANAGDFRFNVIQFFA
jgi:hypothetical protein